MPRLLLLLFLFVFAFNIPAQDLEPAVIKGINIGQQSVIFNGAPASSLLTLTANTDTVLIGGYLPIGTAADTANTDGTQEIFMGFPRARFFYAGNVQKVSFYIKDAAVITTFRIRIWHLDSYPDASGGVKTYTCTGTSADLSAQLVNGVNNITLATPLAVQEGDAYSLQYVASDSGIGQSWNGTTIGSASYPIDSTNYKTSLITDTTNQAWYLESRSLRHFPIKFYSSPSPVIVLLGNSMIDGTPVWRSGVSYLYENHAGLDHIIKCSQAWKIHNYTGWTVTNMGIGSQTSAQILARWSDVVAEKPAFVWLEGGLNDNAGDLIGDSLYKNLKAMVDSCVAYDIPFGMNKIGSYNARTVNTWKMWDTVNPLIEAYVITNGGLWCNMRTLLSEEYTGVGAVAGNDWLLDSHYAANSGADPVHYNDTGHSIWTWKLLNAMRDVYTIPNDTMAVDVDPPIFNIISNVAGSAFYDQFTLDSAKITLTRGVTWTVALSTMTTNTAYSRVYTFDWQNYFDSANTYAYVITGYGKSGTGTYSGSSATLSRPLVPILTSDSSAAPIRVYTSSQITPNFEIWRAFNSDITTATDCWSTNNQATGWVIVDFGIDTTVTSYSYIARNFASFEWKDWTLAGSADSLAWTTVDTQADVPAWSTLEHRRYTITPAKYRYWKWNITATQGGAYLQAVQLQLYGY